MATKSGIDKYANRYSAITAQSIANTVVNHELQLGFPITSRYGLRVHRIEINVPVLSSEIVAGARTMQASLSVSPNVLIPRIGEAGVVDAIERTNAAAAADSMTEMPIVMDYTTFPEGGLLVPGRGVYMTFRTASFALAASFYWQMLFTLVELSDTDYLELMQLIERLIY